MQKAKTIGIEKYHEKQLEKKKILNKFLSDYDAGHRDVFFALAVNLLELDDLKKVLKECDESTINMDLDEKSQFIKEKLIHCGEKRNIELKLRK